MITLRRIRALFLFLILVTPTFGQGLAWEPANGTTGWSTPVALISEGGSVTAVTAQSGRYRSTDDGDTWRHVGNGPPSPITAILRDGTTLYAGTHGGLFRGTTDGDQWTLLCAEGESVISLAVDGATIFAGAESGRVFRSTDGGGTWRTVFSPDIAAQVRSIVVHGRFVTFIRGTNNMWSSFDGGERWKAYGIGGPHGYAVHVTRRDSLLWAVTNKGVVITSADSGRTWAARGVPEPDNNGVTGVLYDGGDIYVATYFGVFRSPDSAAAWQKVAWLKDEAAVCIEHRGGAMLVGTSGGRVLRVGPASNVEQLNIGLDDPGGPRFLAMHRGALYVGDIGADLLRSTNNGDSWHVVGSFAPGADPVHAFVASDRSFYVVSEDYVLRTRDDGATWDTVPALNPKLWLRMAAAGDVVIAANGANLYRSTDDGDTWTHTTYGPVDAGPTSIAMRGSTILIGTGYDGVFRSSDDGATWAQVKGPTVEGAVTAVALTDRAACLAMSRGEYYRSTNDGVDWTMPVPAPEIGWVSIFESGAGVICGASREWGLSVVCSRDDGLTWVMVGGNPLDPGGDVTSIVVDSSRMFASNGATVVRRSLATLAAPTGGASVSVADGPSVAPNPAATSAVLRFRTARPGGYRLSIVDPLGREQEMAVVSTAEPGEHAETIATGHLSTGTYRVVIRSAEGVHAVPLVVIR